MTITAKVYEELFSRDVSHSAFNLVDQYIMDQSKVFTNGMQVGGEDANGLLTHKLPWGFVKRCRADWDENTKK